MDEDRSQNDAALSHSDGGPLRQVRYPGGLESGLYPQECYYLEEPFAAHESD